MRDAVAPRVSVILPTFNRARFLGEAMASIESQILSDIELIVVDDGSTDETATLVRRAAATAPFAVSYVHQANAGAYAARNTGLERASGEFIAFYDSDDLWLPHHLSRCVAALDASPDVDWVYAACRREDAGTGRVLQPTTFEVNARPRRFLELATLNRNGLHVIADDRALRYQFLHGLYCGLQNSVIRRRVFEGRRFWDEFRVVDDVLFLARFLHAGGCLAYFTDVHVVYRVHGENSSASAASQTPEKQLRVLQELVAGFEKLRDALALGPADSRALRRRLAREYFWHLGYAGYRAAGDRRRATESYRRGLRHWPWDPRMWKTYLASLVR